LKLNHYFAIVFANTIVTDAEEMKNYVPDIYKNKAVFIPYGIGLPKLMPWTNKGLKNYDKVKDISPNRYWLVVARLEPENNISTIIDAFSKYRTKLPLIVIGEYTSDKYKKQVDKIAENSDNIIFLGSIYDLTILDMLRQNCFAYIHGHSVGGTNPSLIEAMIMKNIIIAHDNEFNREVCGDLGVYFTDVGDLINKLDLIENNFSSYVNLKEELHHRAREKYSWKHVSNNYIILFEKNYYG